MVFGDAVRFITTEISKDRDKHLCYVANIACAFQDEYYRYCKEHKKYDLAREDIYKIATKAAEHFLDMWLLNADKEARK